MPRERVKHGALTIRTPYESEDGLTGGYKIEPYLPGENVPKTATIHEDPSLEVSWNRDMGWVQVSIDMPRETWLVNAKEVEADPRVTARGIFTDVLSRQEINHLIRTLRRARDAAYGSDE